jgi:uncharacterized protein YjbI with pentapeptide repeats
MSKPIIHSNALYQLLRNERIKEFNQRKAAGEKGQLSGGDYRGLDLRELDADGLDFSDAYFRSADLRGIDFRNTKLDGASIAEAHISGCYFPTLLAPEEIQLAIKLGTRMRYRQSQQ